MDIDWKDAGRDTVLWGLGNVPEVGGLLSALVGFLWPESGADVWSEIKANVEQLIDEKLSGQVYNDVNASLQGLQGDIAAYLVALNEPTSTPAYIQTHWISTSQIFVANEPQFKKAPYELVLLPLFAQFVNLRLALLRDAIQYGETWGFSKQNVADHQKTLENLIKSYGAFAKDIDQRGYAEVVARTGVDQKQAEPFRSINRYSREMTLMVRDFAALWPYFDKAKYPGGPPAGLLNREIFSDPYGQPGDGRSITLPTTPSVAPSGMIRGMQIWGDVHVTGILVAYTEGGGPGGASDTGRMGAPDGYGSSLPPQGGRFQVLPDNPVTGVSTRSGIILDGCQFHFKNGDSTRAFGGNTGVPGGCSYTEHILSSIYVTGWDVGYRCLECAVFGFRLSTDKPSSALLSRFAVTTPGNHLPAIAEALRGDLSGAGSRAQFLAHLRQLAKQSTSPATSPISST